MFYLRDSGKWSHFCGGTIINKWTIITAAHCYWQYGKDSFPRDFIWKHSRVIPGFHIIPPISTHIESFSELNVTAHEIFQVYKINDYDSTGKTEHDLAIIILKTPITFNDNVKPIKLADEKTGLKGNFFFFILALFAEIPFQT